MIVARILWRKSFNHGEIGNIFSSRTSVSTQLRLHSRKSEGQMIWFDGKPVYKYFIDGDGRKEV